MWVGTTFSDTYISSVETIIVKEFSKKGLIASLNVLTFTILLSKKNMLIMYGVGSQPIRSIRFDGSNPKPLNRTVFQIYKVVWVSKKYVDHVRRRQSAYYSFVWFDGSNPKPLNRTIFQIYKVVWVSKNMLIMFDVGSQPTIRSFDSTAQI